MIEWLTYDMAVPRWVWWTLCILAGALAALVGGMQSRLKFRREQIERRDDQIHRLIDQTREAQDRETKARMATARAETDLAQNKALITAKLDRVLGILEEPDPEPETAEGWGNGEEPRDHGRLGRWLRRFCR